jgi:hypothetical protein
MKKEGTIVSEDAMACPVPRRGFPEEIMGNVIKRRKAKGFTVAVFSFEAEQERERSRTGSSSGTRASCASRKTPTSMSAGRRLPRAELERAGVADHVFLFRWTASTTATLPAL